MTSPRTPQPPQRWREFLHGIVREVLSDHATMTAAGLAFYGMLSLVPVLAAISTIYGLIANPADVRHTIQGVHGLIPQPAAALLANFLSTSGGNLGAGARLAGSLAFILWTSQWAASGLIAALNIVYDELERRSFVRRQLMALWIALGGIAFIVLAILLVALLPAMAALLSHPLVHPTLWMARWPLLFVLFALALTLLYRVGPCRSEPRSRWLNWGAILATVLWIAMSLGFSAYAVHVGSFGRYYGSMGAVVVLLLWLYFSGLVVLIGAEFDAALQARRTGRSAPALKTELGERERPLERRSRRPASHPRQHPGRAP